MTTTPELSREQRDAAMVERYADGETLEAIGQSFGDHARAGPADHWQSGRNEC